MVAQTLKKWQRCQVGQTYHSIHLVSKPQDQGKISVALPFPNSSINLSNFPQISVVPTLVRASILILIHPSLAAEEGEKAALRMDILLKVARFSSLLTFPITAVTMAILQQYINTASYIQQQKNDHTVTALILLFWEAINWKQSIWKAEGQWSHKQVAGIW